MEKTISTPCPLELEGKRLQKLTHSINSKACNFSYMGRFLLLLIANRSFTGLFVYKFVGKICDKA